MAAASGADGGGNSGGSILNDQSLFLQHVHRVGTYVKEDKVKCITSRLN